MFLKSAAGRSQPHCSIERPNRDVVQVGRNAASPRPFKVADRALIQILRRGARVFSSGQRVTLKFEGWKQIQWPWFDDQTGLFRVVRREK
jgi:hypothetical protein